MIIIDNLVTGSLQNIEGALKSSKVRFINSSIKECENLKFEGIDALFHMAAYPIRLDKLFDYQIYLEQTEGGALSALEIARKNDIPLFVLPGTTTMYGRADKIPTPEEFVGPDSSLYGTSKYNSERWAEAYSGLFGIRVVIDRFGRILGPRSRNGAIWELVNKLKNNPSMLHVLGDGTQRRSFLDVKDCIDGMMTSIRSRNSPVEKFNIGNEDTASVKDIVEVILAVAKAKLGKSYSETKVRYGIEPYGWKGDNSLVFPDCTKLRALGWKPTKSSIATIKGCVEWTFDEVIQNH